MKALQNMWKGFFVLLFFVFVLVACSEGDSGVQGAEGDSEVGGQSEVTGEIVVAYAAQPPLLDPHANTSQAIADTMRHVWDTLITVDSDYNIKPLLADSWDISDDGKSYTFHLREGVLFHNGKELKAEDVVASLERWKKSTSSKGVFSDGEFSELDDYTVELTLKEPLSTTLSSLAHGGAGFAAIMPKEIIDEATEEGVTEIIGTGPFKFVDWVVDQRLHLTAFEDYVPREEEPNGLAGRREALVKDLIYEFISDSSTREAGVRSGEYDFAMAVTYDNAESLENAPNITNHIYPGGFLVVHFNKDKEPFQDVKMRQAVANALDMDSIMTAAYSGPDYYNLTHNFMMTHQHGSWDSEVGQDFYNVQDLDKARQLLDESGYAGEELRILTTRDYEDQFQGSVVIQEQLKQIGVNVELEVYDWPTLMDKIEDPNNWEIFVIGNVAVPEPSQSVFLNKDYPGWTEDPRLDELVHEFRTQPSLEEARGMFDDLQEWYWDYLPIIKIGDFYRVSSSQSSLENFRYQDGFIFWNVTNDKD